MFDNCEKFSGRIRFQKRKEAMKNYYSFISCVLIGIILIQYRISYSGLSSEKPLKITTWDALGYYMYLPGTFIYHDITKMSWIPAIDSTYQVTGGKFYQASKLDNGNYTGKYLGGIAILQSPFFLIGHLIALNSEYPPDGFSPPYQYAIGFGIVFYFILGVFLLRSILLKFFNDITSSISLLLLILASNAIQYASIDNGQSHAPIFFLYTLIIYFTIKWHQKPILFYACLIGYIIGLSIISRPTEAIMFLIPLLWNTQTKEIAAKKWAMVKQHKNQIGFVMLFGFLGILPQLIYWKITTGSFIYDVGSKWYFLNPFFRVLVGWEKGWFIYTPVTLLFVAGMFFMNPFPFKKSVLYFCLLNIYIIISWSDWRYGGSYSTRALVQSYPMFALPLAALIDRIQLQKFRYIFYLLSLYLIGVNLFQIKQYNSTVLHYYDMNRQYYQRIYLNNKPTPLDMSLLDTKDWIANENEYKKTVLFSSDSIIPIQIVHGNSQMIARYSPEQDAAKKTNEESWLKIESTLQLNSWSNSSLICDLQQGDSIQHSQVRLLNALTKPMQENQYAFYVKVPGFFAQSNILLTIRSEENMNALLKQVKITSFKK